MEARAHARLRYNSAVDEGSPVALTGILKAWSGGDAVALERLTPIVYAELHRLARICMSREREGHRGKRLSPEAGLVGLARPERRAGSAFSDSQSRAARLVNCHLALV